MKKILITPDGGLDMAEVTVPELRDDEVQIRVQAIGVNYADVKIRRGYAAARAAGAMEMGSEVAGIVERTGHDAHKFRVGEKVYAVSHRGGGYAEVFNVPEPSVFRLPVFMSMEDGASFSSVFQTAYHSLRTAVNVQAGETVLIHSAAGGTGTAAVQLAHRFGLKVFAAASSEEKLARVGQLGADKTLCYLTTDLAAEILHETRGEGVRYILDGRGGETFADNFKLLSLGGKVVLFGNAAGTPPDFNPYSLVMRSHSVVGFSMYSVTAQPEVYHAAFRQLLEWMETGKLRVEIGHRLPLAEAMTAHRLLEERRNYGKIVLLP